MCHRVIGGAVWTVVVECGEVCPDGYLGYRTIEVHRYPYQSISIIGMLCTVRYIHTYRTLCYS